MDERDTRGEGQRTHRGEGTKKDILSQDRGTTTQRGEAARPDPRGANSSTTGDAHGGSRGAARDENLHDDLHPRSDMSSAASGHVSEQNPMDNRGSPDKRRGNINDPSPDKPDPDGVPTANEP
jgi:hypothetical protein